MSATETQFDWIEAMQVLELRPGDHLVVKCLRRITAEQADQIVAHINAVFPDAEVLVLPPDLELGVLRT